jgi:hypothetical protein
MIVNTKPLQGALEASRKRNEHLNELFVRGCGQIPFGMDLSTLTLNELMVLHNLFQTLGEAVAELQKEHNSCLY